MTVYGYKRYYDERERKFPKLIASMGYEGAQIIAGDDKLVSLLGRLKVGDVLVIEKLSDICKVPSELPPVLNKLAASPATVYVAELSRNAPIETYASVLSLAANYFAKLEQDITFLKEERETIEERISDYLDHAGRMLVNRMEALYRGPPLALVESLMKPAVDLTTTEPLPPNEPIVTVIESARRSHGLSYADLAKLLGHSISSVHRTCTTGRGPQLGPLIELLTRPRGPGPELTPREPEKPNGRAPIDESWKPAGKAVATVNKPGDDTDWMQQQQQQPEGE